jgi:hypothetical protein
MPDLITTTITRGAGSILSQALSMPEWSKDAGEKYRAGQLIEEQLLFKERCPVFADASRPTKAEEAAFEAWANTEETIHWSERQRDVAKRCLTENFGRLPCGRHLNRLIQAVGLVPE